MGLFGTAKGSFEDCETFKVGVTEAQCLWEGIKDELKWKRSERNKNSLCPWQS